MSNRWLAVVALVACGSPGNERSPEEERERIERLAREAAERAMEGYRTAARDDLRRVTPPLQDLSNQRIPPLPPSPDPPPPAPAPARIIPVPDPSCLSSGDVVAFETGSTLRACIDATGDGVADRCARWRPGGALVGVEPYVEHDVEEPPGDPITFHSDTEHNDDTRIDLQGGVVEICPYDRACMKLMPRIDDGELPHVATDPDYRRAAFVVRNSDGKRGAVELWDLDRGRRYATLPFRGLRRDEEYSFSVKLGPGALLAIAERDSDSSISGAIYGLDGSFRGVLGGGSPTLDGSNTLETAGRFAIVDPQTDDKPYLLHVVDLVAGGAAARFVIAREPEADALKLQRLAPGVIAAAQWGKQLRLDVFDLRTRTTRVLRAPAC